MVKTRLPALPKLISRKLYKTGQTRGADDDEIYQNRVGRSSTVLIPLSEWPLCRPGTNGVDSYEKGFIVLVPPEWYSITPEPEAKLFEDGLELGTNALIFYQTRVLWTLFPPDQFSWDVAKSRVPPLGGQYVARISATTASEGGGAVRHGFTTTQRKGAGIRVYEYASQTTVRKARLQLECLFWRCVDAVEVVLEEGMAPNAASVRRAVVLEEGAESGLLDDNLLHEGRSIDSAGQTICPLCLDEISALGFSRRMTQAAGRQSEGLTVTDVSLFHVRELRVGQLLHQPYNLGWGHHHCNVVAKDAGIAPTLDWMRTVLRRNDGSGLR